MGEGPARAREALSRVGMLDKAEALPSRLSGGQKQRVAIARALLHRPRLILADEPTGNLDSETGRQIIDLFQELNGEGLTLFIVTHEEAGLGGGEAGGAHGGWADCGWRWRPGGRVGGAGDARDGGGMSARAWLRMVGQNLQRARRQFVVSALGIAIGVGALAFFLALSAGVREVLLGQVFHVDRVELERRRARRSICRSCRPSGAVGRASSMMRRWPGCARCRGSSGWRRG